MLFVCFVCLFRAQLADRHHGQARLVRQQTEPAVGHERGVDAAGETDAVVVVHTWVARVAHVVAHHVVPVPVAGAAEHVARAHRRVPPRRILRDRRERLVHVVRVIAGRGAQLRHVVGGRGDGPQTAAESAAATSQGRGDGRGRRDEEIRVRLVRRAARARQAARVPHEHARPDVAGTSAPPAPAARRRRPHTGGTLTRHSVSHRTL